MSQLPITFYLGLAENQKANFEAVAAAALAWSQGVQKVASIHFPDQKFELQFDASSEGSARLKALARTATGLFPDTKNLKTILSISALYLLVETRDYTFEKVLDWLLSSDADEITKDMSDDEIGELAKDVIHRIGNAADSPEFNQVYIELERDDAVISVGVTTSKEKAEKTVPRTSFHHRSQPSGKPEKQKQKRSTSHVVSVTLLRPVLDPKSTRKWGFSSPTGDFSATMGDRQFVSWLFSGQSHVEMKPGIEMDLLLENQEEYIDGFWEVRSRKIERVLVIKLGHAAVDEQNWQSQNRLILPLDDETNDTPDD